MTGYPRWWNQTVTVYHRTLTADNRIAWNRETVGGCFASSPARSRHDDNARRDGAGLICRIPPPCPVLALGDIIVTGACADEIDEYTPGERSTDLLAAHPGAAFVVSELRDNTRGGLPLPHMYAGGV